METDRDSQDTVHSIKQLARVKNKESEEKKEDPRTFTQKKADFN
jgi:hypothetical protein